MGFDVPSFDLEPIVLVQPTGIIQEIVKPVDSLSDDEGNSFWESLNFLRRKQIACWQLLFLFQKFKKRHCVSQKICAGEQNFFEK